jgi:hypothetical protein
MRKAPVVIILWKFSLILLFLVLNYLEIACGYAFAKEADDSFLYDLMWSNDSGELYFSLLSSNQNPEEKVLMKYDLTKDKTRTLYRGTPFACPTINNCGEIFAITVRNHDKDLCIISESENKSYDFEEITQIGIARTWLNCTEAVFDASSPHLSGVFLWNKGSNELSPVKLFEDTTSNRNSIVYHFRFEPGFIEREVIFGYSKTRLDAEETQDTYNLGAINLETGKVWKIVELENFNELFRWFSSGTQDAIYFFKWKETGSLDSLWKVKSDGTGMRRIMDGKEIGQVHYHNSLVSWSDSGEVFAMRYGCSGNERKICLVNIETGDVRNLGGKTEKSRYFSLSPDGKKLAYVSADDLYVLDLETGIERIIWSTRDD